MSRSGRAIADGKIKVDYHMVAFLDRASTTNYSSRALNAAMAVLSTAGPDAFLKFHSLAYANQPEEGVGGRPRLDPDRLGGPGRRRQGRGHAADQRQRLPPVGGQRDRPDVEGRRERHAHRLHQRPEPGRQPADGREQPSWQLLK